MKSFRNSANWTSLLEYNVYKRVSGSHVMEKVGIDLARIVGFGFVRGRKRTSQLRGTEA